MLYEEDTNEYEEVDPETEERPQIGAAFWLGGIIAYLTIVAPFIGAIVYLIMRG